MINSRELSLKEKVVPGRRKNEKEKGEVKADSQFQVIIQPENGKSNPGLFNSQVSSYNCRKMEQRKLFKNP